MRCISIVVPCCLAACAAAWPALWAADPPSTLRQEAAAGLRRACDFFRKEVAPHGGYVWRYSHDLKLREGEGKATETMAWVQPPGTPTVGQAYLTAYRATGDRYYLDAAVETARALVRGQLRSGGWDYRIEFHPERRAKYAYRVEPTGGEQAANSSTLDDNNTQSALRFLMHVDQTLAFKDKEIHEAAHYALNALLKVQYPNGAWPQRFSAPPEPAKFPVKKASYPDSWPRTHPGVNYSAFYTFNDNTIADTIDTMLEAERIYGGGKYRASAEKAGEFIILAQMPDPQPAWAQQYDADMQPAWARRFEPPAVTGGESQGIIRTLMTLYRATGDKKYLAPIPKAIAYLRKSQLPDGRLARFYELQTNRPLYFTKDYQLTYKDDDLPMHYGFKVGQRLDVLEAEYHRLLKLDPAELKKPAKPATKPALTPALEAQVKDVLKALDQRGAWVIDGRLRSQGADDKTTQIIDTQTFVRHVEILSRYLEAAGK